MFFYCTLPGDGPVEKEVEKTKKEEGDEGHHNEVGKEDIVPHIDGIAPQFCGAQVGKAAQNKKI